MKLHGKTSDPNRHLPKYHDLLKTLRQKNHLTIDNKAFTLCTENYRPPKGGNSFVLWAVEDVTGDPCAIKFFFRPNAKKVDRERFIQEGQELKKLSHPRVVRCIAEGFIELPFGSMPCFVMPRAQCSMKDILDNVELRHNIPFTLRFFVELGNGLAYLHDKGSFHRDIKEANILIDHDNLPWVADLGIAHFPQSSLTDHGEKLRNSLYDTPEQNIKGDIVTHKTDVASFGYMLNHWLTGEPPRPNTFLPSDVLDIQEAVALDAVIEQCTAREQEQRYQDMQACIADLAIALGEDSELKRQLGELGTARRQIRALSRGWPQPDFLSADKLRALYLSREKFTPDLKERRLLIWQLLTQGREVNLKLKTPDTDATVGLGWYWLRSIARSDFLSHVRHAISSKQVFVRQGVARVLAALGLPEDIPILWKLVEDTLTEDKFINAAAEAVCSIGILGNENDIARLRDLLSSEVPRIRESALITLEKRGTSQDVEKVAPLLYDPDPNARRRAVWAIQSLASSDKAKALLEKLRTDMATLSDNDKNQYVQVSTAIDRALRQIAGDSESFRPRGALRIVKRARAGMEFKSESEVRERFFAKRSEYPLAACAWYKEKKSHEEIESLLHEHGRNLPFVILQQFDEHLYAPAWWHDAWALVDSPAALERMG